MAIQPTKTASQVGASSNTKANGWTTAQVSLFKLPTLTDADIAAQTNKSINAVKLKRRKLKDAEAGKKPKARGKASRKARKKESPATALTEEAIVIPEVEVDKIARPVKKVNGAVSRIEDAVDVMHDIFKDHLNAEARAIKVTDKYGTYVIDPARVNHFEAEGFAFITNKQVAGSKPDGGMS